MTTVVLEKLSAPIDEILQETKHLAAMERLTLAKLLLESILSEELDADADWSALGLAAFQSDWDNEEDAVYDNWREHYGLPAR